MYLCPSPRVGRDAGVRETASGCEGAEETSYHVHGSVCYKLLHTDVCMCVCVWVGGGGGRGGGSTNVSACAGCALANNT